MQRSLPSAWIVVSALLVLSTSFAAWVYARQTLVFQEEAFWVIFPEPPLEARFQSLGPQLDKAQQLLDRDRIEEARHDFEDVLSRLQGVDRAPEVLKARALDGLGQVARAYGDFYWALQQHREARVIYRQEGLWMLEATNLEYLAAAYTSLGADTLARDHLAQALEVQPVPWRQSVILMQLATLDYLRGDHEVAAEQLRRSFQLRMVGCEQSEAEKRMGKSEVLDRWSGAAMYLGDFETAIRASKSSLAILEELGYARELPIARSNLGVIYNEAGRFVEALALLDRAIEALPEGKYPHERAILHYRRAQSLRGLERPLEAVEDLERSLAWSESVQQTTATTALRSAFASRHHIFHDEFVDLLLEQHFEAGNGPAGSKAWQVTEGIRARDVLSNIQTDRGSRDTESSSSAARQALLKELRRLEHQRLKLKQDLLTEDSDPQQAEPLVADLERRQRDLVLRMQTLDASVEPNILWTSQAAISPPELIWPDLAALRDLLDDNTVVLQFVLGAQRSAVWWLDRQSLTAYPLLPQDALQPDIVQVFEDLARSDQPRSAVEAATQRRRLEDLSRRLLGDLAHRLEDQRLVFIVDGALHLLPFGALLHPETGRALVERHAMVYLPSLSSLGALRQRQGPRVPLHSATVVADPLYHSGQDPVGTQHIPSRQVPALPYSRREADAIRRWLGPDGRGEFFVGSQARQDVLENPERPQTALIHLSLHGELEVDRPEFSSLVFALWDSADQSVDGRLYVHEVAGLDLSSQLLVLSACNTARGNIVSGEGLVGLPYAVLGAGAQRALLSLWFVDDEATALLMESFYELLLGHRLPPDEALRRAQERLRTEHDGKWSAPYHWAGFVLYGDWRWPYAEP